MLNQYFEKTQKFFSIYSNKNRRAIIRI